MFLLLFSGVFAQEIKVSAKNTPLNQVLVALRDAYNIQFSFNDSELSTVNITNAFVAPNTDIAINKILENTGFDYKKSGNVYLIYRKPEEKEKKKTFIFSGKIIDIFSQEPLPFAHLQVNKRGFTSDLNGNFSYHSKTDSLLTIRVSYLGYYVVDSIFSYGNHSIKLTPSIIGLKEIMVEKQLVEHSQQIGDKPGLLKLNNKIISILPGNGDNSVFNLLRLQPGILAAGEQSSDIIIWGSYEGQSQVLFDGFTLFGVKNFNDNISAINPFMVKDMQIYKGAYTANIGERVGGIVDIAGLEGDADKSAFNFNINNMTISGKVSVPVSHNASLIGAFRHTFYNLYESENSIRDRNGKQEEYVLNPDYKFRDFNLKYAGKTQSGSSYFISTYRGDDAFAYSFDFENMNQNNRRNRVKKNNTETNVQWGASAYYNKVWKKGNTSNIMMGSSSMTNILTDHTTIERNKEQLIERQEATSNVIREYFIKNENRIVVSEQHAVELGTGFIYNETTLKSDSLGISLIDNKNTGSRFYSYFQDNIAFGKHFEFTPGLRLHYAFNIQKIVPEPRVSATIKINKRIKINASYGKHHQFISKSAVIDDYDQFRYLWSVANDDDTKVLSANHFVLGPSYNYNGFTLSLEAYYKKTFGLNRFYKNTWREIEDVFEGKSKNYGLDFFVKKEYKGHTAWISYTLNKTLEYFNYFTENQYKPALHDQRHEIKCAAILNFKSMYYSMDYVFGSGLTDPFPKNDEINSKIYSRLDVAGGYKFKWSKADVNVGLSVLNVFNTQNLKYASFVRLPSQEQNSVQIFTEAVPFTPALFLNIAF